MYRLKDKRVLITTDRQSAFDHVLGAIPLKGQVLNRIAQYWFEQTEDIAPNQILSVPDANVTIARGDRRTQTHDQPLRHRDLDAL